MWKVGANDVDNLEGCARLSCRVVKIGTNKRESVGCRCGQLEMGLFILVLAAVAASASGYSTYPGYTEGYYGMGQARQESMGLLDYLNPLKVLNYLIKSLSIFFGGLVPLPIKEALQKLTEFLPGHTSNEQYPPRSYPGYTYPAPKTNYYQPLIHGYPYRAVSGYSPINSPVSQTNGAAFTKRLS